MLCSFTQIPSTESFPKTSTSQDARTYAHSSTMRVYCALSWPQCESCAPTFPSKRSHTRTTLIKWLHLPVHPLPCLPVWLTALRWRHHTKTRERKGGLSIRNNEYQITNILHLLPRWLTGLRWQHAKEREREREKQNKETGGRERMHVAAEFRDLSQPLPNSVSSWCQDWGRRIVIGACKKLTI